MPTCELSSPSRRWSGPDLRPSWRASRGVWVKPTPVAGPSIASKMHRAWIDLKYKLGGRDAGVLDSVEAGEHNAKNHYLEALQADLPPEVQTIVERQAESVFAAYDQVRSLRDMFGSAA